MKNTKYFYKDLPYVEALLDINNDKYFKDVALDWHVIITDIVNSTHEVESGKFKEINLITAATITSLLNVDKHNDIPFVYGGDGAVLLVPSYIADIAANILSDVIDFAKDNFDLTLRAGVVPVIDLVRAKQSLKVCKVKITDSYFLPIFHGEGVEYAENLIKSSSKYLIDPNKYTKAKANFDGLQCVWQTVSAKDKEVISLIIKPDVQLNTDSKVYRKVLKKIEYIYGSKEERKPVSHESLGLSFNLERVRLSAVIHSHKTNHNYYRSYYSLLFKDLIKLFSKRLNYEVGNINSSIFKHVVQKALESEKIDNMLKMVLSGNHDQRRQLEEYLYELYELGELVYGIHVSDSIYMTCFLFERNGNKVQFIDGSNGGYTIASKQLKNRLKWKKIGLVV